MELTDAAISESFKISLDRVLEYEGGYVNDPVDRGGETNYGITIKTARAYGYTGSMRDIPKSLVHEIYFNNYWKTQNLDQVAKVSTSIAIEMFEQGVIFGVVVPQRHLQTALNATVRLTKNNFKKPLLVDGKVGPKTIERLKKIDTRGETFTILKQLNCLQGARFMRITTSSEKQKRFIIGWFKRVGFKWTS